MKTITNGILLLFMLCLSFSSFAQDTYKSAIGLRLGSPVAVSYKTFVKEDIAAEAYLAFRSYNGYSFTAIGVSGQKHNPIPSVERLSWYYGAGLGAYFYSFDNDFIAGDNGSLSLGLQGYLGLDYAFEDFPINISVDWIPTYFVSGFGDGFGGGYGTLAVRYILN